MSPETNSEIQAVQALFEKLCERSGEERTAGLAACRDDRVRAQVERLLAHYDQRESPLEHGLDLKLEHEPPTTSDRPQRIGPYHVRSLLGTGGMGVVYLAEQQNPQREVAVKVLQASSPGSERARRFEREAQFLGRLQHPGIAQIFESGTTSDTPEAATYIAMEYVAGLSLTDHAEQKALSPTACAELLIDLAEAVHHAHLRGVIHRDLKPSNVLVTDDGQIKVIDFGVARALDGDGENSLHTATGQVIGTLAYMSPEQVRGAIDDVDARADVYALGVLAYELFSGVLPFDLRDKTLTAAAKVVCDVDAALLGTRVPACRGDLEQIVAKALEKEPGRRYQSAAALADDLRRFLKNEPILARPASAIYQLRKVARRNRALVLGAAATFVALVIGGSIAAYYAIRNAELVVKEREARQDAVAAADEAHDQADEARRLATLADARAEEARRARAEAEARAAELTTVSSFQSRIVNEIDPRLMGLGLREDLLAAYRRVLERSGAEADRIESEIATLASILSQLSSTDVAVDTLGRTIFDRSLQRLDTDFEKGSETQLALLHTLAQGMVNASLHSRALGTYQRVLAGYEELGIRSEALRARSGLVRCLYGLGRLEEAEEHAWTGLQQAFDTYGETGAEARDWSLTLATVALHARDDVVLAEDLYRKVIDGAGPDTRDGLDALTGLASIRSKAGRFREAEEMYREAHEARRVVVGELDPMTLDILHLLGETITRQGRIDEGRAVLEEALAGLRSVVGEEHKTTVQTLEDLALTYLYEDRLEEAEPLVREALTGWRKLHGDVDRRTLSTLTNLLNIHMRRGEGTESLLLAEEAYSISKAMWGQADPRGQKQAAMLSDVLEHMHEQEPDAGHDERLREVRRELGLEE